MYIKLNAKIYVNGKLQKNELEKIVKMILQGGLNIAHLWNLTGMGFLKQNKCEYKSWPSSDARQASWRS